MEQQQKEGARNPLTVITEDIATRWNSTYDMLVRLSNMRVPLTAMMNEITVTKASDQSIYLSSAQWKLVAAFCWST